MPIQYSREELKLTSMTIWGEARGEPEEGQVAVAWVIRNRVTDPRRWGHSIIEVVLQPYQFSVWRDHEVLHDEPYIRSLVMQVFEDIRPDPTNGANHYVRTDIIPRVGWARGQEPTVVIGHHSFFKL